MAHVTQTVTIGVNTGTDDTSANYVQLQQGGQGILPYSRMVFRGAFELDGTGVGDTGNCRVTLPLPNNTVWQLDQFALWISGTSGYDLGKLELYCAPSTTEFGGTTQMDFQLCPTQSIDQSQGGTQEMQMILAAQMLTAGGSALSPVLQWDPYRIITYNDESLGADPVIDIGGGSATNIGGGTARCYVTFLGYTFEQMNHAGLWTGFNWRG